MNKDKLNRVIENLQSHVDFLGELAKRLEKVVEKTRDQLPHRRPT